MVNVIANDIAKNLKLLRNEKDLTSKPNAVYEQAEKPTEDDHTSKNKQNDENTNTTTNQDGNETNKNDQGLCSSDSQSANKESGEKLKTKEKPILRPSRSQQRLDKFLKNRDSMEADKSRSESRKRKLNPQQKESSKKKVTK